jgi:uncharacterized protein YbaP (TraB family)
MLLAAPVGAAADTDDAASTGPAMEAHPALWYVHGPKGEAYLLGSIHALPKNVHWQTPEILAAVKRADTFVFEIPLDEDSRAHGTQLFAENAFLPFDTALPSYFDQEMRDDYRDVITKTQADPTNIVYLRPWLATLVLQGATPGQKDLFAAEGVDNKIYAMARARGGRHFRAFETWDQQFHILMGLGGGGGDEDAELETLRKTMKTILDQPNPPTFDGLLKAWTKADLKTLSSYGPGSGIMSPQNKKVILENRNRAWIPKLIAMLNEKHTYFITVGAGHLVGPTGVPNLMRAAGYTVDGPDTVAANLPAAATASAGKATGPAPAQQRLRSR